ncbi:type III secretion system chaperone [Pseudothauera rhizosphaerae]|uniref:Type III secretion system chaperone n=1 Tax=Pseudothauera rhizosphaerae TaxID=2565932 RepID=A0A4S4ADU1_9RHOO|nr:type III secretion system chaperone [Pseudothauera rhizosphaerae]THF57274.1 type III secretion system chaperone [Pseudothauera rhizosphaerae]
MNVREQAGALLRAVGGGLGLDLALDGDGACGLRIDDRLDLTLRVEAEPPALLAYAVAGTLPAEGREAVLRRLLAANHLWESSRGATWALNGDDVVLEKLIPLAGLEPETLAGELARFIDVARAEQEALAGAAFVPTLGGGLPPGMIAA